MLLWQSQLYYFYVHFKDVAFIKTNPFIKNHAYEQIQFLLEVVYCQF